MKTRCVAFLRHKQLAEQGITATGGGGLLTQVGLGRVFLLSAQVVHKPAFKTIEFWHVSGTTSQWILGDEEGGSSFSGY